MVPAADLGTGWAAVLSAAGLHSQWNAGAAVGAGGFVTAGNFGGSNATWTLAPSVSAATKGEYKAGALAAYDAQGTAQWVRIVAGAGNASFCWFSAVARDGSGNLWAAGTAQGSGNPFTYGPSLTKSVPYSGSCPLLVEYASDGSPLRAMTVLGANSAGEFLAVACDAAGNVYAAGYFAGKTGGAVSGPSTLTAGQTAQQVADKTYTVINRAVSGSNPLLIKYDASGTFLWARSLATGPAAGSAQFTGLVVSGSAVYAVGWAPGTGTYQFGSGAGAVSAAGSSDKENPLAVKFDLDGTPLWALSRTSGADKFVWNGVAADPAGNLTAVGSVFGTGASGFSAGASLSAGTGAVNPAVVAFDAAGSVRWARTLASGSGDFLLNGVSADADGRIYAAGSRKAAAAAGFGDGVTLAAGTRASPPGLPFLVVYDAAGKALGASGVSSSTAVTNCQYLGAVSPAAGRAVALGGVYGTDSFDFGGGVTESPVSTGNNAVAALYSVP